MGVVAVMSLPAGLFAGMGWLLLSAVIMLPMVKTQRRWMVLLAVMSGLIFGLWRGGVGQSGLDYYEQLAGSKVEISGRITEDPDIDRRNRTVLRLTEIHMGSSS